MYDDNSIPKVINKELIIQFPDGLEHKIIVDSYDNQPLTQKRLNYGYTPKTLNIRYITTHQSSNTHIEIKSTLTGKEYYKLREDLYALYDAVTKTFETNNH